MGSLPQSNLYALQRELSFKVERFLSSDNESDRIDALETSHRLSRALEKPADAVYKLSLLPAIPMVVKIGRDLDIFNTLDLVGQATVKQLALPKKADPAFVQRIMRVLVATGYAEEYGPGLYGPSDYSHEMTSRKSANCMDLLLNDFMPVMNCAPAFFQKTGFQNPRDPTKLAVQFTYGTDLVFWDYLSQHPAALARFNTYMEANRGNRPHWIDWFPVQQQILDGASKDANKPFLVDVAGGRGHEIAYFTKHLPNVPGRFILEDLPSVIDDIQVLNPKIERVKHDFFTPQPVKGARVYYLKHILHDWPDAECDLILQHIAAAMERGYSKLLIEEFIIPETGARLLPGLIDMVIAIFCGGMERSESQWEGLLKRSGLVVTNFWFPEGEGVGIVEAELM